MMSHLDRSHGWLTRLDAIQKILMMIVRRVELNFAQLSGKVFATFPLGVRDVESVAVDPYPALRADPLRESLRESDVISMPNGRLADGREPFVR